MYYVLSVSDDYPDSYWFKYDHDNSPSYLSFQSGEAVDQPKRPPLFTLDKKISIARFLGFDFLMSDGGDFISAKFADLMRNLAAGDVQIIEASVYVNGEKMNGFCIGNIANLVSCVDMEKSIYKPLLKSCPDGPIKFTRFEFIDNSLNDHKIVRCKEDPQTIVVSEDFMQACKSAGIRGVEFLRNGVGSYEKDVLLK
ncbi:hypothetical protein OU994_30680 [Pseudoduganella sp. SL102]|uniref:imm11 family protein n=1 Tax=Pseudoduganella sp. SL102 TaxID=2995154 RepID=UPI00248C4316|nr:DUF1629 domain-containing protein [Pseudoduganella sp. SL102]WBS02555.1 hypothetical protein OU994_30680 [Pseudoduganella sp. SL102]